MGRPRKIQLPVENTEELPVEATQKANTVFFLQDPTSNVNKRILRVYTTEERDALIKRGWVCHG